MKYRLLKTLALATLLSGVLASCGGDGYTLVTHAQFVEVDSDAESDIPGRKPFVLEGQKVKTNRLAVMGIAGDYVFGQFYDEAYSSGGKTVNELCVKVPEGFTVSTKVGEGDLSMYDFFVPKGTMTNENGAPVLVADSIDVVERENPSTHKGGAGGTYAFWDGANRGYFTKHANRTANAVLMPRTKYQLLSKPEETTITAQTETTFEVVFPGEAMDPNRDSYSPITVKIYKGLGDETLTKVNEFFTNTNIGDAFISTFITSYDWTKGGGCLVLADPWPVKTLSDGRFCGFAEAEFEQYTSYASYLTSLEDRLNVADFQQLTDLGSEVFSCVADGYNEDVTKVITGDTVEAAAYAGVATVTINTDDSDATITAWANGLYNLGEQTLEDGSKAKWVNTQYKNAYTFEYKITPAGEGAASYVKSMVLIFTDNVGAYSITAYLVSPRVISA